MRELIPVLAQTRMFSGIAPDEIPALLDCLHARIVRYPKDGFIIEEGCSVTDFGILLSGRGRSMKWDTEDRLIILTLLEPGSEIGVLLAASPEHKSPVFVQAQEDASVLHIPYDRLLDQCPRACPKHERLLRNYIHIVAEKGLVLHERIDCLLKPSLREKILAYLSRVSREQQSRIVEVPMNRNEMADYLNIERSALSRELSSMKRDKIIEYHRNQFELL